MKNETIAGNVTTDSTGFAPVRDGQLYYELHGKGFPLVLVHASCADQTMWQDQVNDFVAADFQVITFDRRGYGRSTANPLTKQESAPNTEPFFDAQDLADLLQYLNITKTFVLGLSGGGTIALDFALAFPAQVAGLILAASSYSGAELQATPAEYALFAEYMQLLPTKKWDQLATLGAKVWVDGPFRAAESSRLPIRTQVYQWLFAGFQRNEGPVDPCVINPPAAGRLAEITIPTLIMWGDEDFSGATAAGETLVSQIKGAKEFIFKDTAHMLNLERPALFKQEVLSFTQNLK